MSLKLQFTENLKKLTKAQTSINYYKKHEAGLQTRIDRDGMVHEDLACQVIYKHEKIDKLMEDLGTRDDKEDELKAEIAALSGKVDAAEAATAKAQEELEDDKARLDALEAKAAEGAPEMVDENDSPVKFPDEEKSESVAKKPEGADAVVQTDIGMEYFDKIDSHSQMSASNVSKAKSAINAPKSRVSRDSSAKRLVD